MMTHLSLSKLALLLFAGLLPALTQAQQNPRSKPNLTRPYRPTLSEIPEFKRLPPIHSATNRSLTFSVSGLPGYTWDLYQIPGKAWSLKDCETGTPIQVKQLSSNPSDPSQRIRTVEIINECVGKSPCNSYYMDGWYIGTRHPNGGELPKQYGHVGNHHGEQTFGAPAFMIRLADVKDARQRVEIGKWVRTHFKRVTAQYC
jgi:hypothetical protein